MHQPDTHPLNKGIYPSGERGCNYLSCLPWLACIDRTTLSVIVYFEWIPAVSLKNYARAKVAY